MKILITGGCGFIGHHFVQHIYKNTDFDILIIDKLSYASKGLKRLRDIFLTEDPRIKIYTFDLISPITEGLKYEFDDIDYIVHFAAETHVDNSILDPVMCITNNIISTLNLLEYARKLKNLKKFIFFSTDEVFGPALDKLEFKEWDRHKPANPYSASKAACEDISLAYENTYKVPIIIMNSMNVFGERQHVEKFIPKAIKLILNCETVEIHCDPKCEIPGSRSYIHARNVSDAVLFIINNGKIGEKYNITGEKEINNLEMVQMIAEIMNKELKFKLVNFHQNRPGHDLRYGLDGSTILKLGWKCPVNFDFSLEKTIKWTLEHLEWLD